jgi:hypothetical protein
MATQEHAGVNDATQAETYFEIRDDLDTLSGKLESLEDLFRLMAMHPSDGITSEMVGFHFSMMNLACTFKTDARVLVDRMMAIEPKTEPTRAHVANSDFYRRTYEEWSAALKAATEAGDELCDNMHATADEIRERMIVNSPTTAGDAALKLRAINHVLFVADFAEVYPGISAALAALLADLERIDAAEKFSSRASRGEAVS